MIKMIGSMVIAIIALLGNLEEDGGAGVRAVVVVVLTVV